MYAGLTPDAYRELRGRLEDLLRPRHGRLVLSRNALALLEDYDERAVVAVAGRAAVSFFRPEGHQAVVMERTPQGLRWQLHERDAA